MIRRINTSRVRVAALALGVGAACSFAFAGSSLAAAPASGTACQAADGKISGRGATFQTKAQQALITGYTQDVCGPVALQFAGDPANTDMITYNYAAAAGGGGTGSGQGQRATSCRTDAFGGTDIPYDQATLTSLNGAPGGLGSCALTFAPPYTPAGPFPNAADSTRAVMSFPVAGASVGIGVHLVASGTCAAPPATLKFSTLTMSKLLGGDYANWAAADLVADNPGLAGCTTPITRVKRFDKSGTTQTFKNYLKNADGARTLCDGVGTWTALAADAQNQNWPQGGTCAAITDGGANGAPVLVAKVAATDGAVGYADAADWTGVAGIVLAQLQTATDPTLYVAPKSGAASNCSFTGTSVPGATNADAVGLNAANPPRNWAIDATPNVADVTYRGTNYPICGFTWDFVYTGLNNGAVANPITGLTANQRRTLYSYMTYVFTPAAQSRLATAGYAAIPASFLTKLRLGFQAGF